ncbi:unnamed protein product [Nezara viridula]|uniref:Uncharacterized protein n=1 Tax=Nezara viridula TaxID=85310 RepID=A0A9P0HP38_NEZVI|nr:unnamed protein product [Nezara viridula]
MSKVPNKEQDEHFEGGHVDHLVREGHDDDGHDVADDDEPEEEDMNLDPNFEMFFTFSLDTNDEHNPGDYLDGGEEQIGQEGVVHDYGILFRGRFLEDDQILDDGRYAEEGLQVAYDTASRHQAHAEAERLESREPLRHCYL